MRVSRVNKDSMLPILIRSNAQHHGLDCGGLIIILLLLFLNLCRGEWAHHVSGCMSSWVFIIMEDAPNQCLYCTFLVVYFVLFAHTRPTDGVAFSSAHPRLHVHTHPGA